jgi:hypothetical protein
MTSEAKPISYSTSMFQVKLDKYFLSIGTYLLFYIQKSVFFKKSAEITEHFSYPLTPNKYPALTWELENG